MRKSEIYRYAMLAVVDCDDFHASTKLEIIEELSKERTLYELIEKDKEERENG